jgi:hypothetical protein
LGSGTEGSVPPHYERGNEPPAQEDDDMMTGDRSAELLEQLIQEIRGMRSELKSIREDVGLLTADHRRDDRMRSPLMGRDLFHASGGSEAESA